ncbi:MAG: peptidoglycan-binding protein, partial [Firmicutes bacterium]|nr:peptidoglycan-binding protein [Bacillota bacterium]
AIKKTDLVPVDTVLGSGSSGAYVKYLQGVLQAHYFYNGKVDGIYGSDMVAAVKNLQAAAGLIQDGKAGSNTQEVIRQLDNTDQLIVNGRVLSYPVRTLRRGMQGWDVYMLQQRLIAGNYLTGIYSKGEYDAATEKAVTLAEKTFRIKEDGIYGSTLRRYLWATNVTQDDNEASKYSDWDDNGNFIGTTLRKGASGDAVSYLQMKLKANGFLLDDADGIFGKGTEKAVLSLQKMINKQKLANGDDDFIKEDGIVGPQTWTILRDLHLSGFQDPYALDATIDNPTEGSELVEVVPGTPAIGAITSKLRQGSSGKQVRRLQQMLIKLGMLPTGADDGFYGPVTKAAVLSFQQTVNADYGSKVILEDGIVGSQTLYHLQLYLSGTELPGKVQP